MDNNRMFAIIIKKIQNTFTPGTLLSSEQIKKKIVECHSKKMLSKCSHKSWTKKKKNLFSHHLASKGQMKVCSIIPIFSSTTDTKLI